MGLTYLTLPLAALQQAETGITERLPALALSKPTHTQGLLPTLALRANVVDEPALDMHRLSSHVSPLRIAIRPGSRVIGIENPPDLHWHLLYGRLMCCELPKTIKTDRLRSYISAIEDLFGAKILPRTFQRVGTHVTGANSRSLRTIGDAA